MNTVRLRDGDRFQIITHSSDASEIIVRLTYELDIGGFVPHEFFHTPNTDRTLANTSSPFRVSANATLVQLFIANVSATATSKRGQTWCGFHLIDRNDALRNRIASGYLYPTANLGIGSHSEAQSGRGRTVDNEAASTLVNNTALTRTISVPTNARWELEGGHVLQNDDVARVCSVVTNDGTAGQNKHQLFAASVAANTRFAYPSTEADQQGFSGGTPVSLTEGDDILITFNAGGASAGGTARSSAVVQEWIDV